MNCEANGVVKVQSGFLNMPKIFYFILAIEFWERFAFYGIQAIAIIYFVSSFGLSEADSGRLFSSFSALLYAALVIGGFIGDKVLGIRRTYLLGILFLLVGYSLLSLAHNVYYCTLSMGVILVGNILFKTNANNYVARCFAENDPRLDSAYTYFYMSINVGSFFSLLFVPILSQAISYNFGLLMCAIGILIGLIIYFFSYRLFAKFDNSVGLNKKSKAIKMFFVVLVSIILSYVLGSLLNNETLSKLSLLIFATLAIVTYISLAFRMKGAERSKMLIALIFIGQAIIFFILYIQCSTSMTLFAYHNVDLKIFNYAIHAGSTQSLNPLFIFILSPILASIYMYCYNNKIDFSLSKKFAYGIMICGLSFAILAVGGYFFADQNAQINISWLIAAYCFYSLGELLISALGASMIAQLVPSRFGGFGQGMWFIASAIGIKLGGEISSYVADEYKSVASSDGIDAVNNNFIILQKYNLLFVEVGIITIVLGVLCLLFANKLSSMIKKHNKVVKYAK